MSISESPKLSLNELRSVKRKSVNFSQTELIKATPLVLDSFLPLLIEPVVQGINLISWAANNQDLIKSYLLKHGGILFRNFHLLDLVEFEKFIQTVSGELSEYVDRSSPRSAIQGKIYTSTDYPADQSIFLHSENSYAASWPLKIFFHCVTPAQQGGETPIADTRRLLEQINPKISDRFIEKGVMYVRNFGDGFGLPWQTVFQTTNPVEVEEFCRSNNIEFEWKQGNRLRTRTHRQAVAIHPKTNETVWFNHATFFHVTTLDAKIRTALLAEFSEEDLPHNTYYGDGSPIELGVLNAIRTIYQQETVIFPWQTGDILMLDNMLTAHGRQPFIGTRKVAVGMSEVFSIHNI
ncbi:MAG: TauD/TfdA family dioxygenase [Nostoc sp.]|uniref:TauD/TfdA family dioxygenase n=1 Tax=Nostoc sp. TaxID=1180 RepID=UPI002FFBC3EB